MKLQKQKTKRTHKQENKKINNNKTVYQLYGFILNPICRHLFGSKWMHQSRFIHATNAMLELVKVPPFADSVSEGDVK